VSCQRSDGATVANSNCGSPATSQSCTGSTSCGPPPVTVSACHCSGWDSWMQMDCYVSGSSPAGGGYPAWSGTYESRGEMSPWDDAICRGNLEYYRGW
jgi:hypothetical protein